MKNTYAIILLIIVTIIFFYTRLPFLGLTTILIALILLVYKPTKKYSKKVWKEVDNAKPKDITPIMKEYVDNTAKITAEAITRKEGTQYQITSVHQFQKGTKNFFSELKKLFK
ncbi:MAG: hypothetical protein PHP82_03870 [Candidatus ainarchaeum sp.]|nr:hypothetical protein [Candidatus ainarchaeum sp.]